jgi:hypothetical protein
MNLKITISKFFVFAGLLGTMYGCNSGNNGKNNNSDTLTDANDVITEENLTFYLIPSPKDMFSFTNDEKLAFSSQVLNPVENADKYIDTKSRELGFGIFSADLAYTAAFSKTAEAANYLKVVRDLSDKIGISSVFDESLVNRFDNIQENKDSLMKVTNDTYFDIVRFLEDNERKSTLALISTGGWLESLYIVSNIIGDYSPDSKTIQLVADQKLIFENLMLYLDQNKNDENIKSVIAELQPIKVIYDQLKEEKTETGTNKAKNKGYVVGGGSKILISKEQFQKLKETITIVRNKLAGNNV